MSLKLSLDEAKNIGDFAIVNWEDDRGDIHPGVELIILYMFDDHCCVEGDMLASWGAVFSHYYNYQTYLRGKWPGAYFNFNKQDDVWDM